MLSPKEMGQRIPCQLLPLLYHQILFELEHNQSRLLNLVRRNMYNFQLLGMALGLKGRSCPFSLITSKLTSTMLRVTFFHNSVKSFASLCSTNFLYGFWDFVETLLFRSYFMLKSFSLYIVQTGFAFLWVWPPCRGYRHWKRGYWQDTWNIS